MKKLFFRYLKQKGVYTRFRKYFSFNYLNKWHPEILLKIKTTKDYFIIIPPTFYLEYAFTWDGTEEGFDFWADISATWKGMCGHTTNFIQEAIELQGIAEV